jgi:hypothetical protein
MPRNGTKNLIPTNQRSKEEARRISQKGGINSGKARREKRDRKNFLKIILESKMNKDLIPKGMLAALGMAGITLDELETNDDLLMVTLYVQSLKDLQSRKYLDELMGRNPELERKKAAHADIIKLKRQELEAKDW